jgi:hypothetical protein
MKNPRLLPTTLPLIIAVLFALNAREGCAEPPAPCTGAPGRLAAAVPGEVREGETFTRGFGPGFTFELHPESQGWYVSLKMHGRDEDLSRLTPPFHSVPNPRYVEGWHFRNADNTGPNDGSVNAPGEIREFIFSPEVGDTIDGPRASRSPSPEEIERVGSFGSGRLEILDYRLADLKPGQQARMVWLKFRACLSWPASYEGPVLR